MVLANVVVGLSMPDPLNGFAPLWPQLASIRAIIVGPCCVVSKFCRNRSSNNVSIVCKTHTIIITSKEMCHLIELRRIPLVFASWQHPSCGTLVSIPVAPLSALP